MCEACERELPKAIGARREKIWELDSVWHCMVVGTCLTLADLRGLARRLDYRINLEELRDYEFHSHFVNEASRPERAGKLLNKLLDRKHAAAIRRFSRAKTGEALEALWQSAFNAGEIPGPLWAAASHPALNPEIATRIYGDVHMLSHLVGAANRADIKALNRLEQENATLSEKLARESRRNIVRAEKHDEAVGGLKRELARAERAEARATRLEEELTKLKNSVQSAASCRREDCDNQNQELLLLRERMARQSAHLEHLTARLSAAEQRAFELKTECSALEQLLDGDLSRDTNGSSQDADCPFDLNGRCILYVGGRGTSVCRLRALVQRLNGEFLHHDGGLEKSIDELASAVTRADAVVFPTDCVSHSAVNKLKRLCRHNMKPFVPLRSAGLSSFAAGLKSGIDGLDGLRVRA